MPFILLLLRFLTSSLQLIHPVSNRPTQSKFRGLYLSPSQMHPFLAPSLLHFPLTQDFLYIRYPKIFRELILKTVFPNDYFSLNP